MTEPQQHSTQTWSQPPPPPAPRPGLSGLVVTAAVLLLVFAVLAGLFALLILFIGAVAGEMPAILANDPAFSDPVFDDPAFDDDAFGDLMGMAQAFIFVFGGIALVMALAHLVAGIGVLKRRNWARITGLVLAGIGIVLLGISIGTSLLTMSQPIPTGAEIPTGMSREAYEDMVRGTVVIGLVITGLFLAAYGLIFFVLLARGHEFGRDPRLPA